MGKVIYRNDWSWKPSIHDHQPIPRIGTLNKIEKGQRKSLRNRRSTLARQACKLSGLRLKARKMVVAACRTLDKSYPTKNDYQGEIEILEEFIKARGGKPKRQSDKFFKSDAWRRLRYKVIKKYGGACMACKATDKPIHADHIKPRSKYPELELDEDNIQILCDDCNIGKWNFDETDWRRGE